jgi:flagellin
MLTRISDLSSTLLTQRYARLNALNLNRSLNRLATGRQINRASDNPAGLIASEQLRSTIASLEAESRSLERTDYVAATADAALAGVSDLLNDANGLAVANANDAGLSDAEKQANQMQIDSILSSVDRIAGTTSFGGTKLLDGSASLTAVNKSLPIDGVATSDIGNVTIDGQARSLAEVRTGGAISTLTDPVGAQQSIEAAIAQVSTLRGKIGAFEKNTIGARRASIDSAAVELKQAESIIADTDYASEVSQMVRSRLLQFASLGSLKKANKMRGMILNLLA